MTSLTDSTPHNLYGFVKKLPWKLRGNRELEKQKTEQSFK